MKYEFNKEKLEKEFKNVYINAIGFKKRQKQTIDYVFAVLLSCLESDECAKCGGLFAGHHHKHVTEKGTYHTKCYRKSLKSIREKVTILPKSSRKTKFGETSTVEEIRDAIKNYHLVGSADIKYLLSIIDKCQIKKEGCKCDCHASEVTCADCACSDKLFEIDTPPTLKNVKNPFYEHHLIYRYRSILEEFANDADSYIAGRAKEALENE